MEAGRARMEWDLDERALEMIFEGGEVLLFEKGWGGGKEGRGVFWVFMMVCWFFEKGWGGKGGRGGGGEEPHMACLMGVAHAMMLGGYVALGLALQVYWEQNLGRGGICVLRWNWYIFIYKGGGGIFLEKARFDIVIFRYGKSHTIWGHKYWFGL